MPSPLMGTSLDRFSQATDMSHTILPLARRDDLVIQTASDETLVFDRKTDKAYVLSPAAAAVWRACDGKRSVREIAHTLQLESSANEQTVWYALGQLNELLQEPVTLPHEMRGISRRQFLKRAGIVAGAAAIPIVVSVVAPTPAHAQSGPPICCVCNDGFFDVQPGCADCATVCAAHAGVNACDPVTSCTN